jgi:hypothetical protein
MTVGTVGGGGAPAGAGSACDGGTKLPTMEDGTPTGGSAATSPHRRRYAAAARALTVRSALSARSAARSALPARHARRARRSSAFL